MRCLIAAIGTGLHYTLVDCFLQVRLQSQGSHGLANRYAGMLQCFWNILKTERVRACVYTSLACMLCVHYVYVDILHFRDTFVSVCNS